MKILAKFMSSIFKRFKVLLAILVCLGFSLDLNAMSLRQAKTHYMSQDYKGSLRILISLVKKTTNKNELVEIYTYFGLNYSMLDRKRIAIQYFSRALKLEPNLAIDGKEMLNQQVSENFQEARAQQLRSSMISKATDTKLLIECNIKNASILIDGKLVGKPFQRLNATPGINKVEIVARGIKNRSFRLPVKEGYINEFSIKISQSSADDVAMGKRIYKDSPAETMPNLQNNEETNTIPEAEPIFNYSAPKKSKSRKEKELADRRSMSQTISPLHFAPLGVWHFYNDQYILGGVSLSAQLLLGYLAFDSYIEGENLRDGTNKRIAQAKEDGENLEAIKVFRDKAQKEIDQEDQYMSIYLTGFFVAWGISAFHAGYSTLQSPSNYTEHYHPNGANFARRKGLDRTSQQELSWDLAIKPEIYTDALNTNLSPGWSLVLGARF